MAGARRGQALTLGTLVAFGLVSRCVVARADEASLWTQLRLGAFQLVPNPLLVIGRNGTSEQSGGGVRWQMTPVLYSFGITERPLRFFLSAPVARHVGAIEFYGAPEWTCCVDALDSGWLVRAGARVYWPVVGRGETFAMSAGGAYYYENRRHGGSVDMGFYTFSSIVGVTVTVSPWMRQRETTVALVLRYF